MIRRGARFDARQKLATHQLIPSKNCPELFYFDSPAGADAVCDSGSRFGKALAAAFAAPCTEGPPRGARSMPGIGALMEVITPRFGRLDVSPRDILHFEQGLIGLRNCRRWVVLADAQNPALGWLQCLDDIDVALGVVSPRRFVPNYQLRIDRHELQSLHLTAARDAQVVVILSRHAEGLALNLRAPLVINVESRRGRQVIAKDALPVRMLLAADAGVRGAA